jgi:hypothetical protein
VESFSSRLVSLKIVSPMKYLWVQRLLGLMAMDRETAKPIAAELQAAYEPWQLQP